MSINIRHDSVYSEVLKHIGFQEDCWIVVPWMRVSTLAPALWAGRVVMQAVVALQVGDVWVRRVRVRHVTGRGTEVMWGGRRSVQVVPMHLKRSNIASDLTCFINTRALPVSGQHSLVWYKNNLLFAAPNVQDWLPAREAIRKFQNCTPTAVTIQNMYTYRCHNTKHVHLPLSQYKTCTPTAVTIQHMYTYSCHNKKHVHLQLSQ